MKVENKGGVEISRTNLLVSLPKNLGSANQPPTFTKTIQSLNAVAGELSRFDGIVVGAKPLEVHWEKNGQLLEPSISHKLLNEGNQYTLLILETSEKDVCLTIGGDHSMGFGTINGHSRTRKNLGVLWIDAHADINSVASTNSGNAHGKRRAVV